MSWSFRRAKYDAISARAIARRLCEVRCCVMREPGLMGKRVWLMTASMVSKLMLAPRPSISLSPMNGFPEIWWNMSQVTRSPRRLDRSAMRTRGIPEVVCWRSRLASAWNSVGLRPAIILANTFSRSVSDWSVTE